MAYWWFQTPAIIPVEEPWSKEEVNIFKQILETFSRATQLNCTYLKIFKLYYLIIMFLFGAFLNSS
jgi:hypothetical protein